MLLHRDTQAEFDALPINDYEGKTCPKITNADRIRGMSDEEKAREFVFFCPTDAVFLGEDTCGKPHYTGLDGKYYSTSEEVIDANLKWLRQPAE